MTKEEKAAWLERYLEGLREEVKTVEERIAEMKEEWALLQKMGRSMSSSPPQGAKPQ